MNAAKQSPRTASEMPRPSKSARILIQDDEETIREIVSSMLTSHYECRGVASPKEALDILSAGEQFDLILCGLLETLGDDFFKRMGEHFPDIPLVVLSACHGFSSFLPALRDGAYDYLVKPFEREQLLIVVRRALEYRRLKLENREYKAKLEKLAKKNSTANRDRRYSAPRG
jgi:DNA-binding NtrC family response regulator